MAASIPGIIDVSLHRGSAAASDTPDLLIEVPHGATRTGDFEDLARLLRSPLPEQLIHFFYVNTDAGAPELAEAIARHLVAAHPTLVVEILCCRIPRTFIDCNRHIDASPEAFREGKVTPGLMPWITDPADRALLRGRYDAYIEAVRREAESMAAMLLLHTFAPRTVDVEVDLDIVQQLHRAYAPDIEPTWPLRPEVEVISRDADGITHVARHVLDALRQGFVEVDIAVAESQTYPLHPSTVAWNHVVSRPGRALCVEVRRDLLADPFEPFAEMTIGARKVERFAPALAQAAWALVKGTS